MQCSVPAGKRVHARGVSPYLSRQQHPKKGLLGKHGPSSSSSSGRSLKKLDGDNRRPPEGQRTRLIEHHVVDLHKARIATISDKAN